MELNGIIFPAPAASYGAEDFEDELIWVPHPNQPEQPSIPCLFLEHSGGSSKYLFYFHGNAEDLGLALEMMDLLRSYLEVHVVGVEYPGYGLYPGKPSAKRILSDASCVFEFFTNLLEIPVNDVILFGRSIGSGPATFLAKDRSVCALILMSAYTSIKEAARNIAGRVGKLLVKERFRNIDLIAQVFSPTFLMHGQQDNIIPYHHSQRLHEQCSGPCFLHLPAEMDHNFFDYYEDLLLPLSTFLGSCEISPLPRPGEARCVKIPGGFYHPPPSQPSAKNQGRMHKLMSKLSK